MSTTIKNVLKTLIYVTIGLVIGFIATTVHKNDAIDILEQNLRAAQDTIEVYQLRNGDLLYEKAAYILNEKNLHEQLNITEEEIKDLKNKLGSSFSSITSIGADVIYDTIYVKNDSIIYNDRNLDYRFSYADPWLALKGHTTILEDTTATTSLYDITVPVPLIVGVTKDNNIFVESKNPYLNITSIEGAVLADRAKKSRWSLGVSLGIGAQYGLINKTLDVGPQVGIGICYKIF